MFLVQFWYPCSLFSSGTPCSLFSSGTHVPCSVLVPVFFVHFVPVFIVQFWYPCSLFSSSTRFPYSVLVPVFLVQFWYPCSLFSSGTPCSLFSSGIIVPCLVLVDPACSLAGRCDYRQWAHQPGPTCGQGDQIYFLPVLRIHDILGGSGSGSGFADPCLWLMDPDPDADPDPAIFVIDLPKMPTKY